MAETTLVIAGRHYPLRCRDGEEAHLAHLAALVEGKAREAMKGGGLTEVRTLLFAALFLADELDALKRQLANQQAQLPLDHDTARAIETLAERVENLVGRLAHDAPAN